MRPQSSLASLALTLAGCTSTLPEPPPPETTREIRTVVVALRHAVATDVAPRITGAFEHAPDGVGATADRRTNSLLLVGTDADIVAMRLLIEQLDVPDDPR